jgi:hypothetical protein
MLGSRPRFTLARLWFVSAEVSVLFNHKGAEGVSRSPLFSRLPLLTHLGLRGAASCTLCFVVFHLGHLPGMMPR